MKQGLFERQIIRREIRKLNREAGDNSGRRRGLIYVALAVIAMIFVAFEVVDIARSKYQHDRDLATNLASEASVELSLINTGLISSDQTMLKKVYQQYRATLDSFNRNSYMQKEQSELLNSLNAYQAVLGDEIKDAHLIKLRTAIKMLQSELNGASLEKVSTKDMLDVKEAFEDFRDSLEDLKDERFAAVISELTSYSDGLISLIDKTSVCVGVCDSKDLQGRLSELEAMLADYRGRLATSDAEVSSYYSPSALVESLKMIQ